jgi:hypothetical protein
VLLEGGSGAEERAGRDALRCGDLWKPSEWNEKGRTTCGSRRKRRSAGRVKSTIGRGDGRSGRDGAGRVVQGREDRTETAAPEAASDATSPAFSSVVPAGDLVACLASGRVNADGLLVLP